MSCFVVPDFHINALVNWGARAGAILGISPDALAHMLACANRAAFSERYEGRYQDEIFPFGGLDRSAGADLAPVAIVKACDCLDYQCSDWSSWSGIGSEPAAHLAAIRAAALALALAGRGIAAGPNAGGLDYGRELPGYDAAAWCLDEPEPEPVADLVTEARAVVATLQDMAVHPSHYARLVDALANMPESDYLAIRSAMAARGAA
jgi:hypothetical protein